MPTIQKSAGSLECPRNPAATDFRKFAAHCDPGRFRHSSAGCCTRASTYIPTGARKVVARRGMVCGHGGRTVAQTRAAQCTAVVAVLERLQCRHCLGCPTWLATPRLPRGPEGQGFIEAVMALLVLGCTLHSSSVSRPPHSPLPHPIMVPIPATYAHTPSLHGSACYCSMLIRSESRIEDAAAHGRERRGRGGGGGALRSSHNDVETRRQSTTVVWGHTDVLGRGASARKLKELHQPGWCWRRGEAGRDNKGHALPTIRPRDPQTKPTRITRGRSCIDATTRRKPQGRGQHGAP